MHLDFALQPMLVVELILKSKIPLLHPGNGLFYMCRHGICNTQENCFKVWSGSGGVGMIPWC